MLGLLDFDYYSKFFGRDVLNSPAESDRAFVANYQSLGYLAAIAWCCSSRAARARCSMSTRRLSILGPVDDAGAVREAIAFYSTASFVFRNGLYRDEEQTPPEKRAALARPGG